MPSVIIKICLFGLRRRRKISIANSSPATVLVWYGPTCKYGKSFTSIDHASLPKTTMSSVSFGYFVCINSLSAMATFLAGVILSSPYKIIEWLMSIISTVEVCDLKSVSRISKSSSCKRKLSAP